MISLSPSKGLTLEGKERHYFETADGVIFIITPGSERLDRFYPSPSVTHEMGQAKEKFKTKPESVIYLVDEKCNQPAIDQKTYIKFNPKDIRSVILALTQVRKDLKAAGIFRTTPIPTRIETKQKIDLPSLIKRAGIQKIDVLFDISNKSNGAISGRDLDELLKTKYKLSTQEINFLKRDLKSLGIII